jgi:hypothetical protein
MSADYRNWRYDRMTGWTPLESGWDAKCQVRAYPHPPIIVGPEIGFRIEVYMLDYYSPHPLDSSIHAPIEGLFKVLVALNGECFSVHVPTLPDLVELLAKLSPAAQLQWRCGEE